MNTAARNRHHINRVIDYVRAHGSETLSLEQLADVACLSRYHFARTFAAHCQETPVEFLTRTRMERAATNLVLNKGMSITEIALDAGFSGSQAFSHAFKRRYAIMPKRFRARSKWDRLELPDNQIDRYGSIFRSQGGGPDRIAFTASLRHVPEMRLAYIRHRGPYFNADAGVEATFCALEDWAREKGIWDSVTEVLGVCPNNPMLTPPRFCLYDVCIPVDETVHEDDVVSIQTMPASTVACLEMAGDSEALMDAWHWLISEWIPGKGLTMVNHASYELYRSENGALLCPDHGTTLCMPVRRKHEYADEATARALSGIQQACSV